MRVEERNGYIAEGPYPSDVWSRMVKGFGANAAGQGINIVSKLVLVPLFLKAWGADIYGEWLLLSSFVAYFSLTDLGGQVYIVNRLTQAYAQRDIPLFRKVLHSGLALFLLLPVVALSLFVTAVALCPIEEPLKITLIPRGVVAVVAAILAAQFLVALPQGILLGVYRAVGLLSTGVMLANLMMLTHLGLTAAGLLAGVGMVWIAALQIVPFGLIAFMAAADLDKRFPDFAILSLREANRSTIRAFVRPSLNFFSIQLSQLFSIQGIVLVAGIFLGAVQVATFFALRAIANAIKQLLGLVTHTTWPEITRLDAENSVEKLHNVFRFVLRTSMAGGCIFFAIFHLWGEDIFRLWLGEALEYRQPLMDLLLLYVLQLVFWTACSHMLMATNAHRTLARVMLASSVLTLVAAYLGSRYFGLEGLIIGMIAAELVLPFWLVPLLLSRHQPVFTPGFYLMEAIPVIAAVMLTLVLPVVWIVAVAGIIFWWLRCVSDMRAV